MNKIGPNRSYLKKIECSRTGWGGVLLQGVVVRMMLRCDWLDYEVDNERMKMFDDN